MIALPRPDVTRQTVRPWCCAVGIALLGVVVATPTWGTEMTATRFAAIGIGLLAFAYCAFILWDSAEGAVRFSIARYDGDGRVAEAARRELTWIRPISWVGVYLGVIALCGAFPWTFSSILGMAILGVVGACQLARSVFIIWTIGAGSPVRPLPAPLADDEDPLADTPGGLDLGAHREHVPVLACFGAACFAAAVVCTAIEIWEPSFHEYAIIACTLGLVVDGQLWTLWQNVRATRPFWSEDRDLEYTRFDSEWRLARRILIPLLGPAMFVYFRHDVAIELRLLLTVYFAFYAVYAIGMPTYLLARFDPQPGPKESALG